MSKAPKWADLGTVPSSSKKKGHDLDDAEEVQMQVLKRPKGIDVSKSDLRRAEGAVRGKFVNPSHMDLANSARRRNELLEQQQEMALFSMIPDDPDSIEYFKLKKKQALESFKKRLGLQKESTSSLNLSSPLNLSSSYSASDLIYQQMAQHNKEDNDFEKEMGMYKPLKKDVSAPFISPTTAPVLKVALV